MRTGADLGGAGWVARGLLLDSPMVTPVPPPVSTPFTPRAWIRTWLWTAAVGTAMLTVIFLGYELLERSILRERFDVETLALFHMIRGLGASVLVGTYTFLNVWRMRNRYDLAFNEAYLRLRDAFARRSDELASAQAQLRDQEKMAALGVLSAGIAHDIANPLASLSSELELLEMEPDPARVRESLEVMRHHVGRITRTLRDMTGFARRRQEETTNVSVAVAIEDALRMVRHDRRARRVRVRTEVADGLPPVRMVEDHLVMVLVNLMINAFDAMPEGGELVVRAEVQGSAVHVSVHDTGVGMDEEVLRRATEPLFTTKPGGGGTGLGLTISHQMMAAAGGALEIESAPNAGTTVHLSCPAVTHA